MSAPTASRAISSLSRPALKPLVAARNARGHAAAVEVPTAARRYVDGDVRHDWRRSEIQKIFDAPLMDTIFRAVSRAIVSTRTQS